MELNHDSPASIRSVLESRGIAPRKRWGQNFLINRGAREKIVSMLDAAENHNIWEIGPGLGSMSIILLEKVSSLTMFEIDPAYCEWLNEYIPNQISRIKRKVKYKIVKGDVLRNWQTEWKENKPDKILGNLPYNAASAIIASFIESGRLPTECVFTVQDEMGQRMTAQPGSKDYSSFSILVQTAAVIKDGGRLSRGSFYPAPRVSSRIIKLVSGEPYGKILNPEVFRMLVRSLFLSKRKTLLNNINASSSVKKLPEPAIIRDAFISENIDLSRRPETVSPGEWVNIANKLAEV